MYQICLLVIPPLELQHIQPWNSPPMFLDDVIGALGEVNFSIQILGCQ